MCSADRLVKLIASAKRNEAAALAISSRAHSSSLVVSSSVTKSAVASPEDSVGIRPHRLVVGDVSSVHSLSVNVPELSQASLDTANSSFIIKPRNAGECVSYTVSLLSIPSCMSICPYVQAFHCE